MALPDQLGDREYQMTDILKDIRFQLLVEHMAAGLSFESFAAVIEVSRFVLYDWCKVHDEFLDAKKVGFDKK